MKKLLFACSLLLVNIAFGQPFTFTEYIISPGVLGSNPYQFHLLGSKMVFSASDSSHGPELWATDGTLAGTQMIQDICPDKCGSAPDYFEAVNNQLYFLASHSSFGRELWVTDGSQAGTKMVKDINIGKSDSNPQEKIAYKGYLIFEAEDSAAGNELWISDGTDTGTHILKDINPGKSSGNPTNFILFNGKVYFVATNTIGTDIWCTDGTTNGTQQVSGIFTGSSIYLIKAAMGKLFMIQYTSALNDEIWVTDGTPGGTQLLQEVVPGPFYGIGSLYTIEYKGRLLMYATTPISSSKSYLYITDGTPAGTEVLDSFRYVTSGTEITPDFCEFENKVYFVTTVGTFKSTPVLFATDGTPCGTKQINDINNGGSIINPATLTNYNGYLYLTATPQGGSRHLARTDGTDTGTVWVSPPKPKINPIYGSTELIVYDSSLYYSADYVGNGRELWSVKDNSARSAPTSYQTVFGNNKTIHTSDWNGLGLNAVVYGIKGDTLIDCIPYKNVSISWNQGDGFTKPLGLLREDTITGKVWYRHLGINNVERLVMDMTLNIGDTFVIGKNSYLADTIVVDTVYIMNNRKHIEFKASIPGIHNRAGYKFSFIEGLGTSFGLCYKDTQTLPRNSSTGNFIGRAICFYKDSVHLYSMPIAQDYDGCRPPAFVNEAVSGRINIYPNPTTGPVNIFIPENIPTRIVFTDINGRVIYNAETEHVDKVTVDMTGQPKGIYLVHITNEQGTLHSKILVQ